MVTTKPAANIKLYRDCSELPIWNFHHAHKDRRWLIKGWEDDETELPEGIEDAWFGIFNEYCDLVDDRGSQDYLQKEAELDDLKSKYKFSLMLFDVLMSGSITREQEEKYLKELSAWGFTFDTSKIESELERAQVWLKSIMTKIGFLSSDLEEYRKKKTPPVRLEKQQVSLERATNRNDIDIKKVSVTKWIMILKDAEETAKTRRKQNGGK